MAQSGFTPIQLYRTTTASATPTAGNLADGELAVNLTDERLYFKNASGVVKLLAANVAPVANGGTGQTTYTDGELLIGNTTGNTLTKATLTAGTGISITNGSGSVTIAATGGGTTGYTFALNTAAPNDTNNVSSLTASGGTTNQFAALLPKGTSGVLGAIPDSSTTGGNVRGSRSVDFQFERSAATQVASGSNSAVISGRRNTASSFYSGVFAGDTNIASSTYAVCLGGNSNTASSTGAAVVGSNNSTASGNRSGIVASSSSTASGGNCGVFASASSTASGNNSAVLGGASGNTRGVTGLVAMPASANVEAQGMQLTVYGTSSSAFNLTSTVDAASAVNQLALNNNSAVIFRAQLIVRLDATGESKGVTLTGVIKRGANAAATAIVGTVTTTTVAEDAALSTVTASATADTTNGALTISVNPAAVGTVTAAATIYATSMA